MLFVMTAPDVRTHLSVHFLMNTSALEAILHRDRAIITASLAALTALAWCDLVRWTAWT
jgi:hypothetical protein